MKQQDCVYILRCRDGSFYTGWTNDPAARVATHNCGEGAKYTRGRGPVELVYLEYTTDRSAALKREMQIKKLPRTKKERLITSSTNALQTKP